MTRYGDKAILSINGCNLYNANREIVETYWKWICKLPKHDNPFLNNDGIKDEKQNANRRDEYKEQIFFLSPADSGRSHRFCEVPSGQKILIPSLCVVATGAGKGGERPDAKPKDLIGFNKVDQDNIEYRRVKIDGQLVSERYLRKCRYNFRKQKFEVNFPEDNPIFNAKSGACNAVADGVYIIMECPSESDKIGKANKHTVHLEGKINLSDNGNSLETANYTEDVMYALVQKAE
jgi:hypothetical protein